MIQVSILLPIYNGARYLPEALDSVLAQVFKSWELLALDDGSDDDTPAILEAYAAREPRLHVHRLPHRGLIETLNHGLDLAQSKYIARLDADDRMHRYRLEYQVRFMLDNPAVGICGSAYQVIDEDGQPGDVGRMPLHDAECRWQALFHSPFAHPTVLLRRAIIEQRHLRYDPDWQLVEDFDLWLRFLDAAPGCNLQQALLDYRVHAASVSSAGENEQQAQAARLCVRSLAALGVAVTEEEAAQLRSWYYRWPRRFEPHQFALLEKLWQALLAFIRQPARQGHLESMRGRWLARLLLTPASRLDRKPWYAQLSTGDLASLATYPLKRAIEEL
jgi:glycosyltransferase involved in cell wall biosynthesis